MAMTLTDIQNAGIARYRIRIDEHSTCRRRMHAHVKERRVCKWEPKSSLKCTFDLFHEIGHVETTRAGMRRAESEYHATCWAIDRFKEYGLEVPEKVMILYQSYILMEVARGQRRGGTGYGELNIYRHAGIDKSLEEFKKEISPKWAAAIRGWK